MNSFRIYKKYSKNIPIYWGFAHSVKNLFIKFFVKGKEIRKSKIIIYADLRDNLVKPLYHFLNKNDFSNKRVSLVYYITPNWKLWYNFNLSKFLDKILIEKYIDSFQLTNEKYLNILIRTWDKIFKISKCNLFIIYNEYSPTPYASLISAKKNKIIVVALQHGVITPTHPGYQYDENEEFITPDYLITWGEYEKNIIHYPKNSKCRVVPLGSPQHDFLAHMKFDRKKLLKKYKLNPNKKIILWATQGHDYLMNKTGEWDKTMDVIYKVARKLKKTHEFIIKLHPGEEQLGIKYKWKAFLTKTPIKIFSHNSANLHELISISDYVIVKHSTVGMEAILMGTPVINTEVMRSYDLSLYQGCPRIHNSEDLENILFKNIFSKNSKEFKMFRKKFIKEHFANFGHATEKVGDFILRLLSKSKRCI